MELNAISNAGWGYVVLSTLVVYILTYVKSDNKYVGAQYGFSLVPMICGLLATASCMIAIGILVMFSGIGAFLHICGVVYAFKKFGYHLTSPTQ